MPGTAITPAQALSAALVLIVHVVPSGEVITRLPVPLLATATNKLRSEDQQTDCQALSAALVRVVQFTPSGEVITRVPVPDEATATNTEPLEVTDCQLFVDAAVWLVHVVPSGEVMQRPASPTATNRPMFHPSRCCATTNCRGWALSEASSWCRWWMSG